MLLSDPSGNVIEVKAYRNPSLALKMEDLPESASSTG
jgi:hypothetical protein